jgi:hypothetical protein
MRRSAADEQTIREVAGRCGFSPAAVSSMLEAVRIGQGRMAQFDHPEFGGAGQWMRGGMTMISDMFNATLKARVERLCDELSRIAAQAARDDEDRRHSRRDEGLQSATSDRGGAARGASADGFPSVAARWWNVDDESWWPPELGRPNGAGAQNGIRYAYFNAARRLAINSGSDVTVYDTLDHRIGGVSQQQSARGSLSFSSQHGLVDISTLPVVTGEPKQQPAPKSEPRPAPKSEPRPAHESEPRPAPDGSDVFATIEKLADLHSRGILSEAEFAEKKAELLRRL